MKTKTKTKTKSKFKMIIMAIKEELKRLRSISKGRLVLVIFMALLMSGLAVMNAPLNSRVLLPVNWATVLLIPLIALFFFYAFSKKPVRSVFWFTKGIFYIAAPLLLIQLNNLFFDPNKIRLYSENFLSLFLPKWITIWWLGTVVMHVLARCLEFAVDRGISKGDFIAKFVYDLAVMLTPQKIINSQKREGKRKWIAVSVCMLMLTLALAICTVTLFLHSIYSNMEFEAILFTITFASGGLATEDVLAGGTLVVFFVLVTGYFGYHLIRCFKNEKLTVADVRADGSYTLVMNSKKRVATIIASAVFLVISSVLFIVQTEFLHYIGIKFKNSSIYETYYVEPGESVLKFPKEKRNLIYIFLESMENTYASKDVGGDQSINYISELTDLVNADDSVNFSNTEQLGGASVYVPAITHTMGSTVAQTSGIALNTKLFSGEAKEFPAVKRLEDVLHENGYNQLYIEGSKGEFSMYDAYVGRYEDSKVYDRKVLVEKGYASEKADYIWKWGIEDQKLIEITEQLITEMSQKDKPFFVTMYTMDTHTFECGHRCSKCDSSIGSDYLASIDCSSKLVSEFVEWIKQQPFFENTTVILVGDHLGNKKTTMVEIDDEYIRTTYNCIINPAKEASNTKNRIFSSLDMFPTALSSIGVEIKGDRLGLGTDLFSETKTLCEELGTEEFKEELERGTDYLTQLSLKNHKE